MDLSNYKKVEHLDGRIEFIPIKKESSYLTVGEATALRSQSGIHQGDMLLGYRGVDSVINLDASLGRECSEIPFELYINAGYDLEHVGKSDSGTNRYCFKKNKAASNMERIELIAQMKKKSRLNNPW